MRTGGVLFRTLGASGVLAILVSGAFAVLLISIDRMRNAANKARHSESVLSVANQLERLVIDLETGERGFLITRQERFLAPWQSARRSIPGVSAQLQKVTDVPPQRRRARRIDAAIKSYIRDYSVPLVRGERRDGLAREPALVIEGKRRIDTLRELFNGFVAAERKLAAERQNQAVAAAHRVAAAAVAGVAGSLLLVLLFAAYLGRAILRPVRRAARMAHELAVGDLAVRMPETGPGEVGELERSFNTMARSLEQSRDELAASRARIVAATDESRRRIERDLHDGTQQRLVALGLELRAAVDAVPSDLSDLKRRLSQVGAHLNAVVRELQEITRGIHPSILAHGGLKAAVRNLARRSGVPVELDLRIEKRFPQRVEVAAYYLVSEALTNAAKHSRATLVQVRVEEEGGNLKASIRDDGVGGAAPGRGSGLIGLKDRVEALGGQLEIESPAGGGTSLVARIPIAAPAMQPQ